MITATRCPVVANFAGTRHANQIGSSRVNSRSLSLSHLATTSPLVPSKTLPSAPSRGRVSRLTVSANSNIVNYSADDLSSNNNGTKALLYKALAASLAATGIALIISPTRALQFAFNISPTTLISGLTQALGSIHILAAIAANCLADAASHARLSSDTYKRLNLGLILWGAASLAAYYKASSVAVKGALVLTPNAQILFYALFAATTFLPILLSGKAGLFAPLPPAPRMRSLFTAQRVYSVAATAAAIFAIAVGYTVYSPGALNISWLAVPLGSLGGLLLNLLASGALLGNQVLVNLEDAARRGRLGASTFKALNWGVAIVSGTLIALIETGIKSKIISLWPAFPETVAEFSARWPDVFSEFAVGVVVILGCVSLYTAIAAKKK